MKASDVENLPYGTLVMWDSEPNVKGMIVGKEQPHWVWIRWWDGKVLRRDSADCQYLSLWEPKGRKDTHES